MNWRCASCGWSTKTNRRKCPRCGSGLWKSAPKKDLTELSGPLKRIAPRGLLLTNLGKRTPIRDSAGIECGRCHVVIYIAEKEFDAKAFQEARKLHYSISPSCEGKVKEGHKFIPGHD